jgi:hypothetical protein
MCVFSYSCACRAKRAGTTNEQQWLIVVFRSVDTQGPDRICTIIVPFASLLLLKAQVLKTMAANLRKN